MNKKPTPRAKPLEPIHFKVFRPTKGMFVPDAYCGTKSSVLVDWDRVDDVSCPACKKLLKPEGDDDQFAFKIQDEYAQSCGYNNWAQFTWYETNRAIILAEGSIRFAISATRKAEYIKHQRIYSEAMVKADDERREAIKAAEARGYERAKKELKGGKT